MHTTQQVAKEKNLFPHKNNPFYRQSTWHLIFSQLIQLVKLVKEKKEFDGQIRK